MRRAFVALLASLCALALAAGPAAAAPRVVLAFLPLPDAQTQTGGGAPPGDVLLDRFERTSGLAFGLDGATQGSYSVEQALLDITSGARLSPVAFSPRRPGPLRFEFDAGGGFIVGWRAAVRRAATARAKIRPGLLAASLPGGAGYAGVVGADNVEAVAATDRDGRVAQASLGSAATIVQRARGLLPRHRLVVVGLPRGAAGARALDALLRARAPDELLIVAQRPPRADVAQLLPIALAGEDTSGRGLRSDTTRRDGLVAGIDVLPTVLHHLGLRVPKNVRGARIRTADRLSAHELRDLRDRLEVIGKRRLRTLFGMLVVWAGLLMGLGLAGWHRHRRLGLRVGALAFLWLPSMILVPAALRPGFVTEMALIAGGSFALGAITDRLLPWPRSPILPVVAALLAFSVDLGAGSSLTSLSLLGSNPRYGSRYYGIGNELEALLVVLLLIGLAAATTGRPRSRRLALSFALAGLGLGVVIGWGKMGADVGGVITASVGTTVATLMMLPGGASRRALALAPIVPIVSVGALAALDLVTGGNSHFSHTVLQAEGTTNFWHIVERRYDFAYKELIRGMMPAVTATAVLGIAFAYRNRSWLYAPLRDHAWRAALAGGVAAGIAGSLANDSGPVLLVVAVFVLGVATAYIQGDPRLAVADAERIALEDGGTPLLPSTAARRAASTSPESQAEPEPVRRRAKVP